MDVSREFHQKAIKTSGIYIDTVWGNESLNLSLTFTCEWLKPVQGMSWRRKLKRAKAVVYHPAPSLFDPLRSLSRLVITARLVCLWRMNQVNGGSATQSVWSQSSTGHQRGLCSHVRCVTAHEGQRQKDGAHLGLMACLFSTNLRFMVWLWVSGDKSLNGFPGMQSSQRG